MDLQFDPSMNPSTFSPQSAVEKRNCVEKGYYEDEFIVHICPKTSQSPVLSIFDYIRVVGNRTVISHFFKNFKNQKVQFVNLGCGMDSLSLWVMTNFTNCVCYDLDLEFQTRVKKDIIFESEELLSIFPTHRHTETSFHSDRYHLVINKCTTMSKGPSIFINHEHMINKGPIYEAGRIALEKNKTPVYTLFEYPNAESQANRYKSLGWDDISVLFYTNVYNYIFPKDERIRVTKIEDFKEFHTLGLYCSCTMFGVATKNCDSLQEFIKLFTIPKTSKVEEGDRLIPHFSEDEVDKEEPGPFLKFVEGVFEVTYSTKSEECQRYYRRF
ncbi:Leucine carboxyl methyltransferase 2 [Theileria orientalis]|uniref:Leucine carboxyl methyltransferase 2 n=1 Tax=Theileria orientalis TaxID=68886 RepID=A0A976QSV7_THEOR|nr:Leucine carboxyl methyltransferase 2 [Theileria orientalis]